MMKYTRTKEERIKEMKKMIKIAEKNGKKNQVIALKNHLKRLEGK